MPGPSELVGLVLSSRYRLVSPLGEGGMAEIWRAEHLVLGAPVAVKLIDPEIAQEPTMLARFLQEAKAAASLRSPHVVQVLDYGVEQGRPFIVMELLEGETLRLRLKRKHQLDPLETARIISHVARAVGRAHEANIVHRDLKPENVFLVTNEDEELAKVLDFGVAKLQTAEANSGATRTGTGILLGTPNYMSPEQVKGDQEVDYRSDLWSLGVMAFECLTGERPFKSVGMGELVLQICTHPLPVPSRVAPVPVAFDGWFARAAARDPDRRFQSARELAEALREALGAKAGASPEDAGIAHPDTLATVIEGRSRVEPSPSDETADGPFAATLVAATPLGSADEIPSLGGDAFDADPPVSGEPTPTPREFWFWFGGLAVLVLALAGVWLRTRARSEPEPDPSPSATMPPVEPAPSQSARKRAARSGGRRARERPPASATPVVSAAIAVLSSAPTAPTSVSSGHLAPEDAAVVSPTEPRD